TSPYAPFFQNPYQLSPFSPFVQNPFQQPFGPTYWPNPFLQNTNLLNPYFQNPYFQNPFQTSLYSPYYAPGAWGGNPYVYGPGFGGNGTGLINLGGSALSGFGWPTSLGNGLLPPSGP